MNRISLAALALSLGALPAAAASVGFSVEATGDTNVPILTVVNTSTFADLTAFSLTIGDLSRNFDIVYPNDGRTPPPDGTIKVTVGDELRDLNSQGPNDRTDVFALAFTGFGAGESAGVQVDLDRDSSDSNESFRRVFFNNGDAPNAEATATFSTGDVLTAVFDDLQSGPFIASASRDVDDPSVIPLPAGLPLVLLGLGALGLASRRRG